SNEVMNKFGYEEGEYIEWNVNNADGEYIIHDVIVSSDYQLTIRSVGYVTHNETNININNEEDNVIKVTLQPGASIIGKVQDEDGNPLIANYYVYGSNSFAYGSMNDEQLKISGISQEDLT